MILVIIQQQPSLTGLSGNPELRPRTKPPAFYAAIFGL